MAQREQHERVKKMDRWAGKLLGHKAVVVAILVVIAMASGLAMASFGGESGGVSFERAGARTHRRSRVLALIRMIVSPMGLRTKLLPNWRSMSMSMAPLCHPECTGSKMERGCPKRSMPPEGLRPRRM